MRTSSLRLGMPAVRSCHGKAYAIRKSELCVLVAEILSAR
jgi:hypothetical protein